MANASNPMPTVYTVGHSTRPADEFVLILNSFAIECLVDIRTIPRSKRNPQFDQDFLKRFLLQHQIEYLHVKALGGFRQPGKDSTNTGWRNESFRGYADYMQTEQFGRAIGEMIALLQKKRIAMMCAEAVPWRCHRSLVGDALVVRGIQVLDIFNENTAKLHKLTPWARVEGLTITYPPLQTAIELE